jgi:hypothetical protein
MKDRRNLPLLVSTLALFAACSSATETPACPSCLDAALDVATARADAAGPGRDARASHDSGRDAPASSDVGASDGGLDGGGTGDAHTAPDAAGDSGASGSATPVMPVISFGVPAYASSAQSPASNANDGTQNNAWRSIGYPAWLAYDLSSQPTAARQTVFVSWWSPPNYGYDAVQTGTSYNLPGDYVLEGNASAGGTGSAPTSGWVQLNDPSSAPISVTANSVFGREHVAMLNGMSWIRLRATAGATTNATENTDIEIAMDVHDASKGLDAWNFIGDSITAFFQVHNAGTGIAPAGFADGNFQSLIHGGVPGLFAGNSAHRPAFNGNGLPGTDTTYWVTNLSTYVPIWPSPYVGIQLGANDPGTNPTQYYDNMVSIVTELLAAGKSVYIATPSWQSVALGHQDMSQLAAQVPLIVAHFAGKPVYAGPDMYAFFSQTANQTYITTCLATGNCGLHPIPAGQAIMRNLWAEQAYTLRYGP